MVTWVNEAKLKLIVGKVVKLEDVKALREVCSQILGGRDSIGEDVIEMV
jgi:hypothetical protein